MLDFSGARAAEALHNYPPHSSKRHHTLRHLFEQSFGDIQNEVRALVADLEQTICTQQRRMDGMKRFIQQHRVGKECN